MKTALAFLMLSALTYLAPMPALSETVTYTCRYDSFSDEKGLHKAPGEFRLVFVVLRPPLRLASILRRRSLR